VPEKLFISIVDDDHSVREGTMDLFKAMGFRVAAFSCAADFLTSNHLHRTGCLIADVRMPGMTGLDLHDRLIESGHPIPTILITAYPDDGDQARARKAGVICYLAKPYRQDDLLSCVRRALDLAQSGGREL
jgi:FixJ family two-component response regulator